MDDAGGEAELPGPYVAAVKGTYGTLPRGYPWAFLPWAAVVAVLAATYEVRSWYGVAGGTLIFASVVVRFVLMTRAPARVFRAYPAGIRLGGQRKYLQIPWEDIAEIRVSPAPGGALADIVLLPSFPVARPRLRPAAQVALSLVPWSFLFLQPPLLEPVTDPAGYRAPLSGTTTDRVADGLRALAPDSVPVVLRP